MVGTSRFTVPFAFPLAVSAGLGIAGGSRVWRERRSQAALAVVLVVLAISATRPVFRPFLNGDFAVSRAQALEWYFFRY